MSFIKKYEPLLLLLIIIPTLLLRVTIESTHYCTPDSDYYLEVSNNILSGNGCVGPKVFDFDSANHRLIPLYSTTSFGHPELYQKQFFAVWPLGYPAGIVGVSWLTGLEPLWASKVFNILLLLVDFYLITLLFGKDFSLPLYFFGSYAMLEICSYTWSENLFLSFFLLFIIVLKKIQESEKNRITPVFILAISLTGMCLSRYASAIFFVGTALLLGWFVSKKEWKNAKSIVYGLTISALLFGLYLLNNYWQSGYLTGMPRVNTQDFTATELIEKFFLGIYNQLHIIKQFRISNNLDLMFYGSTIFLQLLLMSYIAYLLITRSERFKNSTLNNQMIIAGILYLIFLIYMTFTSTIDPFDYRTLLPFYFPATIALLNELEIRLKKQGHLTAVRLIKLFFILSILLNLPKQYIIGLL